MSFMTEDCVFEARRVQNLWQSLSGRERVPAIWATFPKAMGGMTRLGTPERDGTRVESWATLTSRRQVCSKNAYRKNRPTLR